jgi:hypothetical protein
MEAGEWIQLERHITGLYAAAGLAAPLVLMPSELKVYLSYLFPHRCYCRE